MNPELINVVTAGAAAAGYAAGLVTERIAVDRAAQQRDKLNEAFGFAAEAADPVQMSRWSRFGNTALAPLALGGAVALGLNVYAWAPETQTVVSQPAVLEVVVDRSGATKLAIEGTPVAKEIDHVVSLVTGLDKIKSEAIVASSGTLSPMNMDHVAATLPFGEAKMPDATTLALNRAAEIVPVADGQTLKRNAAVIVITNGNSIGKTASVVAESQQGYGIKNPTPVFIVNVEGDKAGPKVAADLQAIAVKTGAQYWSAGHNDLENVAQQVRDTIVSSETVADSNTNKWPLRGLGLVSIGGLVVAFRRRGSMSFGRGIKGE